MKVTIVEGTPDEIARALPHFGTMNPVPPLAVAQQTDSERNADANGSAEEAGYVDTELARLILRRRPLSKEQLIVLRTIYDAHPNTVLATELITKTGYTRAQFSGLMGAFGRRISHTEGYEDANGAWFFAQEWNSAADCYEYSLPETVREAMRLEKLM